MKKYSLLILFSVLIFGLIWFGYKSYKRSSYLSSGKSLILIHTDNNTYTFSDTIDSEDLTFEWDILGYKNDYTSEEIQELVEDRLFIGSNADNILQPPSNISLPESIAQESLWKELLTSLSQKQKDLCQSLPIPETGQFCLTQHIVYNAIRSNASLEVCDGIFIDSYKQSCITNLTNKNIDQFQDNNNDNLLDNFVAISQQLQ